MFANVLQISEGKDLETKILPIKNKQIKIYFLYLLLCVCIQKLIPYKNGK
jgi:hypothetical protein